MGKNKHTENDVDERLVDGNTLGMGEIMNENWISTRMNEDVNDFYLFIYVFFFLLFLVVKLGIFLLTES